MTREVLISIKGLQFEGPAEEHHEPVELMVGGSYSFEVGVHHLLYEEEMEGMPGKICSRITATPERVQLSKEGGMAVSMVFEQGQKNLSSYRTPFGNLMIAIDTTDIRIREHEDGLDIEVFYHLDMNYEYFADCRVLIGVKFKN